MEQQIQTTYKENTAAESKSRLGLLFKKELLENKKTLLTELIVAWGTCILLGSFLGLFGLGGGEGELIVFFVLLQYISFIYASLIFSSMKHKRGRIATLMLPVSIRDKFLMRWIMVVPVLAIIGIIGVYFGDIFRIIVAWLSGSREGINYFHIIDVLGVIGDKNSSLVFAAITSYFFGQAFYLFGAILWPKLSFLKTFAVVYCLQMILGMVALILFKFWLKDIAFSYTLMYKFVWIAGSIQIVLTLLLYWLTYYKFRNSSVVYRLF